MPGNAAYTIVDPEQLGGISPARAFDAGYEAGAEDAGSGELLVEALDLRYILEGEAILE